MCVCTNTTGKKAGNSFVNSALPKKPTRPKIHRRKDLISVPLTSCGQFSVMIDVYE
jgi:hypothetical protein